MFSTVLVETFLSAISMVYISQFFIRKQLLINVNEINLRLIYG